MSVYLLACIFFPGTFIHEMSHAMSALFLLVPFGKVELLPKYDESEQGIKMGSVGIAKTDPVRRFLIGVAPFIFGTSIILIVIYFLSVDHLVGLSWWKIVSSVFIVFEIGNMMFASKKDLEGAGELFIFVIIILLFGILLNVQLPFVTKLLTTVSFSNIISSACIYLLAPITIDLVLILIFRVI